MSFSLVWKVYLSAGVATRRATKINTNMSLSSSKNVCEVALSTEIFTGIQ